MKRTVISIMSIIIVITLIIVCDAIAVDRFVKDVEKRLVLIQEENDYEMKKEHAAELLSYCESKGMYIRVFVPADRIDELRMLIGRLYSYSDMQDDEAKAIISEIQLRIKHINSFWSLSGTKIVRLT